MNKEIEEIFGNILRNLPFDDNDLEKRTFSIKKILRGGWNGYIFGKR